MTDDRDEPRSFHLSHGKSDLWMLLGVAVLWIIATIAPAALTWLLRALLVAMIVVVFRVILLARQMPGRIWRSPVSRTVSQLCAVGLLAMWVFFLVRAFRAGFWLNATLVSLLVVEFTYLTIFQHRHRVLDDDD